jgi:hypothetical protein
MIDATLRAIPSQRQRIQSCSPPGCPAWATQQPQPNAGQARGDSNGVTGGRSEPRAGGLAEKAGGDTSTARGGQTRTNFGETRNLDLTK